MTCNFIRKPPTHIEIAASTVGDKGPNQGQCAYIVGGLIWNKSHFDK